MEECSRSGCKAKRMDWTTVIDEKKGKHRTWDDGKAKEGRKSTACIPKGKRSAPIVLLTHNHF